MDWGDTSSIFFEMMYFKIFNLLVLTSFSVGTPDIIGV